MLRVYKYTFKLDDYIEIELPRYTKILDFNFDYDSNSHNMWALVNPLFPNETRRFRLCGTGHKITELYEQLRYITSYYQDKLVWHIFELFIKE